MISFQRNYFLLTLLLFCTEVFIAVFMHDRFIRPYAGDFLVVILLYCFVRSFIKVSVVPLAVTVLIFAYAIEIAQYFHFASWLGYQNHNLIRIILGSAFEWSDLLAYTLGILLVIFVDRTGIAPASK